MSQVQMMIQILMTRIIDRVLKYWWITPLICLIVAACSYLMVGNNVEGEWIYDALAVLFLIFAFLQVVLFILALIRKKFLMSFGIFCGGVLSGIGFFIISFVLWAVTPPEKDTFGQDHPIPEDLVCLEPDESFCEEDVDSTDASTWLRIQHEYQPGRYEFQYFSTALPDGYIYLKCYEATANIRLSEDRILKHTQTEVSHHTVFGPVGGYSVFTVYEGDIGDLYAVRAEVWHHETATNKERMLCQKVYRMQGWER